MDIIWSIDVKDINRLSLLISRQKDTPFVDFRRKRNLVFPKGTVTKQRFWRAMVCMRLTTMQQSGPTSAIAKFSAQSPFPISYAATPKDGTEKFLKLKLAQAGLNRFSSVIPAQLAHNFACLEQGEWVRCLEICNGLTNASATQEHELEAAEYIRELFKGFGPKQSRNLLQALGLTRYEMPIDSRVIAWLNHFGFPLKLSAGPLQDPEYYGFISSGIQQLCSRAGIEPCLLDAIVFSLNDVGDWNEASMAY
jgi:hypothetical protein